ncbi:MAG TPA: BON domain-containing protein [Vicinamibacterales bacterium]|jgi:hyperosmotically inducible protein|nr:BON domain-containing protein [Vicinamibacterales bacterium]
MRIQAGLITALAFVGFAGCTTTDDKLTKEIEGRLASDQIVHGYHLDVKTEQKVVSLSGTVETSVAKDQALAVARGTSGVVDVRDHIAVRANEATKSWLKKSTDAVGTSGRR